MNFAPTAFMRCCPCAWKSPMASGHVNSARLYTGCLRAGCFVDYDKPGFVGRDAALRDRDADPAQKLVTFGNRYRKNRSRCFEPLWVGDKVAGYTTSGGYGHTTGKSLAWATCIMTIWSKKNWRYQSWENAGARQCWRPAYDPGGVKLR